MAGLSVSPRRIARMVFEGTLDEAVKAGKLREHHAGGIELSDNGTKHDRTDFVFPSHAQVSAVADAAASACGSCAAAACASKKRSRSRSRISATTARSCGCPARRRVTGRTLHR